MNKRGFFLAEETMKIILAVICLVFLVFILAKMYYSYAADKELQQAKDTLARIEKEINSMKIGDERDIVVYSPNSWVLISFSGSLKPAFCSGKGWESCLCICESVSSMKKVIPLNIFSIQVEECDKNKNCVFFPGKTLSAQQINLENLPVTISVNQNKDSLVISKK